MLLNLSLIFALTFLSRDNKQRVVSSFTIKSNLAAIKMCNEYKKLLKANAAIQNVDMRINSLNKLIDEQETKLDEFYSKNHVEQYFFVILTRQKLLIRLQKERRIKYNSQKKCVAIKKKHAKTIRQFQRKQYQRKNAIYKIY